VVCGDGLERRKNKKERLNILKLSYYSVKMYIYSGNGGPPSGEDVKNVKVKYCPECNSTNLIKTKNNDIVCKKCGCTIEGKRPFSLYCN